MNKIQRNDRYKNENDAPVRGASKISLYKSPAGRSGRSLFTKSFTEGKNNTQGEIFRWI